MQSVMQNSGFKIRLISISILFCLLLISASTLQAAYIEVTLLGTGTPRPDVKRFGPATLIEAKGRYFLFDAGRGVSIRLEQADISLSRIEQVFITHLHSDHINGLADLWATGWIWRRRQPLKLFGPKGLASFAQHTESAYAEDIRFRQENTGLNSQAAQFSTEEIDQDGVVYDQDGVRIIAFRVNHGLVKPAFGYRLEADGYAVVISGDTTYSENLIKHAQNADLLIHEIAAADPALFERHDRLQKVMAYHTTPDQLSLVLKQTKPRLAVLNHVLLFGVKPLQVLAETSTKYAGRVLLGQDLLKVMIGREITTRLLNP